MQYYKYCTKDISINKVYYTRCPILKVAPKYFFSEAFSEKMFQTKIVWIEGRHKRVPLI